MCTILICSISFSSKKTDSAWPHQGFTSIRSSTSSSIEKRGLPAAPLCSRLELFFTSKPLRVLVMVVDSGVVLPSTLSRLKHRTQLGGQSRHAAHTSIRVHTFSLMISTFRYQSPPSLVNGTISPAAVLSIVSSPLFSNLWLLAASIGIDRVGSVSATTLNVFTWAVPLIGGICISTTHSSQSSSLCNWLHLPTQFQEYALSMALYSPHNSRTGSGTMNVVKMTV